MNNKITSELAIGAILLIAIVVGGIFYFQNKKTMPFTNIASTLPVNKNIPVVDVSENIEKNISHNNDNQNNNVIDEFTKNLCNNGLEKYYKDNFGYSISVYGCGEYYSLEAKNIMDAGRSGHLRLVPSIISD